jgi:hypothetical protein
LGSVGQGSNGPPVPSRWSASQGQRRSEGCGSSIGAYTDRYAARCFHRGSLRKALVAHSWERWGCTLDEKLGSTFILPPLSRRQSGTNIGKKTGQGDAEGSGRQGWQNLGSNNVQWKSIQNESAAWDGGWRVQKLRAAEAPTEDTVAVFDPMGSRRRPRGNATVEWGCSQEAAKPPRNQHRVRAGARGWLSLNPDAPILPKRTHMEGRGKRLKEKREGKNGWMGKYLH